MITPCRRPSKRNSKLLMPWIGRTRPEVAGQRPKPVPIGRGGIERLFEATGVARITVRAGLQELGATQSQDPPATPAGRQRRTGGGRKRLSELDPDLRTALEQLVEPLSRGDPTSPLRWTCKSAAKLAKRLQAAGHPVSELDGEPHAARVGLPAADEAQDAGRPAAS